jgi:hypothetical protein
MPHIWIYFTNSSFEIEFGRELSMLKQDRHMQARDAMRQIVITLIYPWLGKDENEEKEMHRQ